MCVCMILLMAFWISIKNCLEDGLQSAAPAEVCMPSVAHQADACWGIFFKIMVPMCGSWLGAHPELGPEPCVSSM
jgi:hypothetical protein